MLAVTNEDDGSSIEAWESRKSHGKIGDCEQSTVKCETNNSLIQLVIVDVLWSISVAIRIYFPTKPLSGWVQNVRCSLHVFLVDKHMHIPPMHFRQDSGFIPRADFAIPAERRHSNQW